jgi:hypothetical protein
MYTITDQKLSSIFHWFAMSEKSGSTSSPSSGLHGNIGANNNNQSGSVQYGASGSYTQNFGNSGAYGQVGGWTGSSGSGVGAGFGFKWG